MSIKLIADSGSTKTDWCLIEGKKKINVVTQGISPYFHSASQVKDILTNELLPKLKKKLPLTIFFYGTGCGHPDNISMMKKSIRSVFPESKVYVNHDLEGAARALCVNEKGIACILGTGSNSCYYNGKKIVKNSPGLGYVLGDEGSGSYLGKNVLRHYLYNTFDPDLMDRFNAKYRMTKPEILDAVYKKPLANRFLAGFVVFLTENRGHYMVENIIEDGINDFFYNHLYKYSESWKYPIHFTGSVAHGFRDVLKIMCDSYELHLGKVLKTPMEGLIEYHGEKG